MKKKNSFTRPGGNTSTRASGKLYAGGLKSIKGPMQSELLDGQDNNRSHKASFRDGSQDARDTDGLFTVTQPRQAKRSPAAMNESKRAAVPRSAGRGPEVASE